MKAIIQKKVNEVESLTNDIKGATSILAFEYHTVPAKNIAAVRRVLHDSNAKMYVAKNNIFNRAFKLANVPLAELSGPNAIIVAHGDEVIPFKEIHKLMNTVELLVMKPFFLNN